MKDLQDIRIELDEIDRQILALYERRLALAEDVAVYKEAHRKPVLDKAREDQKLKTLDQVQRISGSCQLRLYEDSLLPLYKLYQLESVIRQIQQDS